MTSDLLHRYLVEAGYILPSQETSDDVQECYRPLNPEQQESMESAVAYFDLTGVAHRAFPPNPEKPKVVKRRKPKKAVQSDLLTGEEPLCCGSLCILRDRKLTPRK